MLNKNSEEFGIYFLLEFTKELIRNSVNPQVYEIKSESSASPYMYKLNLLLKQREKNKTGLIKEKTEKIIKEREEIKKLIKEKVKQTGYRTVLPRITGRQEGYIPSLKKEGEENLFRTEFHKSLEKKKEEPKKSPRFYRTVNRPQRGMPLAFAEPVFPESLQYIKPAPEHKEIDLQKINTLIQDPVVRTIECNGPDQKIIVSGVMGLKETGIVLTKEDVEGVIRKFSEETKIPLHEGFFKAVSGKLILSAIYSESAGSKFIIKKMVPEASTAQVRRQNVYSAPKPF